jgi:hypothetical protein
VVVGEEAEEDTRLAVEGVEAEWVEWQGVAGHQRTRADPLYQEGDTAAVDRRSLRDLIVAIEPGEWCRKAM